MARNKPLKLLPSNAKSKLLPTNLRVFPNDGSYTKNIRIQATYTHPPNQNLFKVTVSFKALEGSIGTAFDNVLLGLKKGFSAAGLKELIQALAGIGHDVLNVNASAESETINIKDVTTAEDPEDATYYIMARTQVTGTWTATQQSPGIKYDMNGTATCFIEGDGQKKKFDIVGSKRNAQIVCNPRDFDEVGADETFNVTAHVAIDAAVENVFDILEKAAKKQKKKWDWTALKDLWNSTFGTGTFTINIAEVNVYIKALPKERYAEKKKTYMASIERDETNQRHASLLEELQGQFDINRKNTEQFLALYKQSIENDDDNLGKLVASFEENVALNASTTGVSSLVSNFENILKTRKKAVLRTALLRNFTAGQLRLIMNAAPSKFTNSEFDTNSLSKNELVDLVKALQA